VFPTFLWIASIESCLFVESVSCPWGKCSGLQPKRRRLLSVMIVSMEAVVCGSLPSTHASDEFMKHVQLMKRVGQEKLPSEQRYPALADRRIQSKMLSQLPVLPQESS